ncbi:MAG: ribosome biogenesis GTP-binding protein YihA/YsxC [Bacteroidetes bacterium]|nr:ribosome biogenesis GTP-binding protein YihA/YsxC [Bacteroidota bacterium]
MNLKFVSSIVHPKDGPGTGLPEFAFIGRSNVGKSSLINMLAGRKSLAKTSSSPGKTRTINHYLEEDLLFYLVDLPGYGYAKLSKVEKAKLEQIINSYILKSPALRNTFILVDARHEPLKQDAGFMSWMIRNNKPFVILFTKTDKLSKPGQRKLQTDYIKGLQRFLPGFIPGMITTSSTTRVGREEIENLIKKMMLI